MSGTCQKKSQITFHDCFLVTDLSHCRPVATRCSSSRRRASRCHSCVLRHRSFVSTGAVRRHFSRTPHKSTQQPKQNRRAYSGYTSSWFRIRNWRVQIVIPSSSWSGTYNTTARSTLKNVAWKTTESSLNRLCARTLELVSVSLATSSAYMGQHVSLYFCK